MIDAHTYSADAAIMFTSHDLLSSFIRCTPQNPSCPVMRTSRLPTQPALHRHRQRLHCVTRVPDLVQERRDLHITGPQLPEGVFRMIDLRTSNNRFTLDDR